MVVTSGKPSARSKRIWWPKTLRVPVPVRSVLARAVLEHVAHEVFVLAADGGVRHAPIIAAGGGRDVSLPGPTMPAMLPIAVSEERRFHLDAPLPRCAAHFGDFARMLQDLPELRLVGTRAPGHHRIAYVAAIAEVYRVELHSDVCATFDARQQTLVVQPDEAADPVPPRVTLRSMTGQGDYSSRLALRPAGAGTGVDFQLRLSAELPTPVALRLLPASMRAARSRRWCGSGCNRCSTVSCSVRARGSATAGLDAVRTGTRSTAAQLPELPAKCRSCPGIRFLWGGKATCGDVVHGP